MVGVLYSRVMHLPPTLPPATDETALLRRLLARDERALQLLYERHASGLLAVIRRVVRDEAMAQDLLQEGLLKVWQSVASYDAGRGRLFTWMARVCCNHAIDAVRNPRYRFHHGNPSLEAVGAHWTPAPATFNPEHIGVRDLARRLKPRQREVIELLYFGGCTQAETAATLGVPVSTVKTRARAAIQALSALAHGGRAAGGYLPH